MDLTTFAEEIAAGTLVALRPRAAWMQTGYGFAWLRDTALSPAAEAFRHAVWSVEREISAREAGADEADGARMPAPGRATGSRRR